MIGESLMGQRNKRYLLTFIAIFIMIIMIDHSSVLAEQDGVSSINYLNKSKQSGEFYTDLDGEWMFFEQALLTPNEVEAQIGNRLGKVVMITSSLESQTGEIISFVY